MPLSFCLRYELLQDAVAAGAGAMACVQGTVLMEQGAEGTAFTVRNSETRKRLQVLVQKQ